MVDYLRQVSFVGVSDLGEAERFYGGVLGLGLDDARPFALVHESDRGALRITAVDEVRAAPYIVLGWTVADLDGEVDRLTAAGVVFETYDGLEQDARGIWAAPSGARIARSATPTATPCRCRRSARSGRRPRREAATLSTRSASGPVALLVAPAQGPSHRPLGRVS